ncbi:sucrose phosphorylase [Collibacillus ludicampi]|uniref:Sucrose phosphorylase n=1 Tax=Collibacillus ludicampi TaxID=2771369 RepID=A0AAV4LJC7_9BACL|nr:alpha-amylase family glycosyl hydrolase [Collibacillus ludicampi]GIM47939.1 sucrose phosphorylase [Collibacillus ludicampi]
MRKLMINRKDIPQEKIDCMRDQLNFVYGEEKGKRILEEIIDLLERFEGKGLHKPWVDEKDVVLITYGDQIKEEGKPHLQSLHEFLNQHLKDVISAVHILPFYPYSSDDGFSVIDYFKVNPELGTWNEIEALSGDFELMFDAVINHISARSDWFREYVQGNPEYKNFFIESDPNADYSTVTRPRALPLLTSFETKEGTKHIWTTFSEDQIDLNYKNEKVLLKIIEVLLFYVGKGARFIRLDAIGYLWKRLGTSCIHLEETHKIVQLFRNVLEIVAPGTIIITETNVPHKENISYFGNGYNEAHMVYQFPLPPLTLNALHTGNASHLLKWADSLEPISDRTTFFNFLASHDGIGVMPAKGILSEEEIQAMVKKVKDHGGYVSYKNNGDGTQSPYELNINYFDALSHPEDPEDLKVKRFIVSQSILLSLAGVPGIYIHSLLGSRNDQKGVEETGRYRSINREKLSRDKVEEELDQPSSLRHQVFNQYKVLLRKRRSEKVFHPNAEQRVLFLNDHVFSLLRTSLDGEEQIICLHNVSHEFQTVNIPLQDYGIKKGSSFMEIISEQQIHTVKNRIEVTLEPYQVMWIKAYLKRPQN